MGASMRPEQPDERSMAPADLWDAKVKAGMPAAMATEYVSRIHGAPPPKPAPNAPAEPSHTATESAALGLGNGLTFGFGDELEATADAAGDLLHGKKGTFAERLRESRAMQANARSEHPIASATGEIAGGVASSLVGGAGLKALGIGGKAVGAASMAEGLTTREAASLAAREAAKAGAKGGAAVGALTGAGNANGSLADRAKGAVVGGAVGGVTGAVAPSVIRGVSSAGGKLATTLGLRPTGRNAAEIAADRATMRSPVGPEAGASKTPLLDHQSGAPASTGTIAEASAQPSTTDIRRAQFGRGAELILESAKKRGLRLLGERLDLDNVSPADAVALTQRFPGKPIAVLDVGGGNVSGLARTAKDVPGLGRRLIPEFLHGRSGEGETLGRITGDIEQRIGLKPENYYKALDDMIGEQKTLSKVAYDKVRGTVVDDPEVLALFDHPEWRGIHERIATNARLGGKEAIKPLTSTSDIAGEQITAQNPQTLGTLDKMKRQLDKIIEGKIEGGPIDKDHAFVMRGRLNQILEKLDTQHPEYAEARAGYRGRAELMGAYEAGKDELMKLDPRQVEAKLAAMPERLQDLYRRGGYDALRSRLTKQSDGSNMGGWLEKNPDIRARVAALAKTPEDAAALRPDLGIERHMGDRKNAIMGGPNTAERIIEHASTVPRVTQIGNAARALPGVGKLAGGLIDNTLTRRTAEQTGDVMGELAKVMTRTGQGGVQQTFDDVAAIKAEDIARAFAQGRQTGRFAGAAGGMTQRR